MAEHVKEWAGIPVGIEGQQLVVDPSYRFASVFAPPERPPVPDDGYKVRNCFNCAKQRCDVYVYSRPDGKVEGAKYPRIHHFDKDLHTMGCHFAWGIEQESNALHTLGSMVKHHQFKAYLLTGMFLESSKRSGLTYMFRRLKPTVVMTAKPHGIPGGRFHRHTSKGEGVMSILTTLCLHPIAYYAGTWAGAMCPSDDVIAHLSLMRGDEHGYWKKANQHAAWTPEAGL